MRQVRYRALIELDPVQAEPAASHLTPRARRMRASHMMPNHHPRSVSQTGPGAVMKPAADFAVEYLSHTRTLMVRAECLSRPGHCRCFTCELSWDDDEVPLHPGDRHEVTITVTDDEASAFLGAGQRITLWRGAEVGHGTISRQVFTEYGPV